MMEVMPTVPPPQPFDSIPLPNNPSKNRPPRSRPPQLDWTFKSNPQLTKNNPASQHMPQPRISRPITMPHSLSRQPPMASTGTLLAPGSVRPNPFSRIRQTSLTRQPPPSRITTSLSAPMPASMAVPPPMPPMPTPIPSVVQTRMTRSMSSPTLTSSIPPPSSKMASVSITTRSTAIASTLRESSSAPLLGTSSPNSPTLIPTSSSVTASGSNSMSTNLDKPSVVLPGDSVDTSPPNTPKSKRRKIKWNVEPHLSTMRRAVQMALGGHSTTKVAEEFGIPARTLRRYVANEKRRSMGGITDDGLRLDGGPRLGQGNRTSANSSCSKCKNVFDPLNLPGMSGALPPPPPRDTSGFERKLRSQSMETLLQSFDNKSSLDHHDSFHTHSYSTEMSEPGFWKRQRLPSLDSTMSGPSAPEKKARLRTASLDRFFHNMAPDASEDSIPLDLPNIPPANSSQPSLFANPDATPFGPESSLSESSGADMIRTRPDSSKLFSFGGVSPDTSQQMMVKEEGTLSDFNRRNFNRSSMTTPPSPFLENDDDLLTDIRMSDTCDSKIYISAIDPGKALKLDPGIELSTHGGMLGPDIWA